LANLRFKKAPVRWTIVGAMLEMDTVKGQP
jgi:hypothetical protein